MAEAPVKNTPESGRDERGRWVKGVKQKAGPGRPPTEFSITEILRAKVIERPKVIEKLLELAESEDENVALRAIQYIANRIDGMPKQSTENEHKHSGTFKLKWDDGSDA